MLCKAFDVQSPMPLVIVGNWNNSPYGIETKAKYSGRPNLVLLDAIYDRTKLDILRSNCTIYLHGHSAGGTNPSLCEAMYLGLPVFAFASGYNEHTSENKALYFKTADELRQLMAGYKQLNLRAMGDELRTIAKRDYRWSVIADNYKQVFLANVPTTVS